MLRISVALAILIAPLSPADAQQTDVLRRLQAEPVTLFDWGLAQLDRDINTAARRAVGKRIGMSPPRAGSRYSRRSNLVTVFVAAARPQSERTRQMCAMIFSDIVAILTEATPGGPDGAGWYLQHAFQPKAHFWASRFEDVGAKLLEVVRLEITLIPPAFEAFGNNAQRVRCVGRLDATPDEIAFEETS